MAIHYAELGLPLVPETPENSRPIPEDEAAILEAIARALPDLVASRLTHKVLRNWRGEIRRTRLSGSMDLGGEEPADVHVDTRPPSLAVRALARIKRSTGDTPDLETRIRLTEKLPR